MSSSESSSSTSSLENCKCSEIKNKDNSETESFDVCCHNTQGLKNKKPNSLSSLAQNLRRGRSLTFSNKRLRKNGRQSKDIATSPASTTKKSPKWVMKFNCTKKERKCAEDTRNMKRCVCTCYRRTEEHHLGAGVVFQQDDNVQSNNIKLEEVVEDASCSTSETNTQSKEVPDTSSGPQSDSERTVTENAEEISSNSSSEIYGNLGGASNASIILGTSFFDISWLRSVEQSSDDCDEQARLQRAREIAEGVEPPANFHPVKRIQLLCPPEFDQLDGSFSSRRVQIFCPPNVTVDSLKALFQTNVTLRSCSYKITGCHTQVDYIHCLVPDLLNITNCTFYWGKMDRYEAERLLEGKPEGTFLLRDSAQEEFLFSVSFRKYGRSLHARIEQWNHKFSFDSHDPSVFASDTVCGLIEHYKDPSSCMFFEPMLTSPLHRNFTFQLQHLCRAVITSRLNYDSVNQLQLPKSLKSYLKEYHYRQKVRVERFDDDVHWIDLVNVN